MRTDIGRTHLEIGETKQAEEFLDQALEMQRTVRDRRITAITRLHLSRVRILQGRADEAIALATEALGEFGAMSQPIGQSHALELIARAESDRGNLAAARGRMEEALRLIERNRTRTDSQQLRASFFATTQDSFHFYIDLLMRLRAAHPAEQLETLAFETNERSRSRSLIEMLAESGESVREGADPMLLAREHEMTGVLNAKGARLLAMTGQDTPQAAALRQEIRTLEAEYQDVEAAIRASSPRYAALTQPAPLDLKQIQALLDRDSLLLEYSLGEKRSYLWAVSAAGMSTYELPPRAAIEAQVDRVYQSMTARGAAQRLETPAARMARVAAADAALARAARELSGSILGPVEAALGKQRLVIVPDGALQRLPFAMLPLARGPVALEHEIVMLPSASALAALRHETRARKPAPKMLAVFADPVFDAADPRAGAGAVEMARAAPVETSRVLEHLVADPQATGMARPRIPRLPYTLEEARQILSVARDPTNLEAVGFGASREAAADGRLGQYRYVHFATHGYLNTEHPSLSGLVLSQLDEKRRPVDGFLRVNDIYNARLSAELVVLSACQTGLGKEVRGEGLMGLTRAFLYAGAPRVIVSLWNVNDRATASLMASFYRRMLREGKRPPAALREAQMEMRKQKQWESPYYWAAFVQHGEWR